MSERTTAVQTSLREIELRSPDGTVLRGSWWRRPAPRGIVIISHGFGEHGRGYRRVAESLGGRLELDVIAIDYRGHGRSGGRRGVVLRYEELTDDLSSAIDWAARHAPNLRRFVLGHSNGGQVALRTAAAGVQLDRWIGGFKPGASGRGSCPGDQAGDRPNSRPLCPVAHLEGGDSLELADARPGNPGRASHRPLAAQPHQPSLYFGMLEGGEMLMAKASEIRTPILMLLGAQDPVIDPIASREFFDRLGSEDKTLSIYPKMLHEPFNEVGRQQVMDDVVRWIEPRLTAA